MQSIEQFSNQDTVVHEAVNDVSPMQKALMDYCNWNIGCSWRLRASQQDAELIATIGCVSYLRLCKIQESDKVNKMIQQCIVQNSILYYNTSGTTRIVPDSRAKIRMRWDNEFN